MELKTLFPEQLSSLILSHVKTKCELFFDDQKRAVVKAYRRTHSYTAVSDYGCFSGWFVEVKLISEPTAAALAYGLGMTGTKKGV